MVTKSKMMKTLKKELRLVNPEFLNGKRTIINWPMVEFRHELKRAAEQVPQIMSVAYEFNEKEIKDKLTTVILKSSDRTIRLQYDYKTDNVNCFAIGKDLDVVRKTINVHEIISFIKEYFPQKKRVVILRKK